MNYEHRELKRQDKLVEKLIDNGFKLFKPQNYDDIIDNFKEQVEYHNRVVLSKKGVRTLSDMEFKRFLNAIDKGSITSRTEKLFRHHDILLDNGDNVSLELFSRDKWCENRFQVAKEVRNNYSNESVEGKARFDVMLFINGLPLVSIELKQSSVSYKEGIDQIIEYKKNKQYHGLFGYIQIFIVSDTQATRYFANNEEIDRNFIFCWTDVNNNILGRIYEGNDALTNSLLQKCNISEMIARFIIPGIGSEPNIILRPYQVYASKAILEKVKDNSGNGYIFHTTGSGKTITSFKTCKLVSEMRDVDKVIFLVDRKDLDNQTKKAYGRFEPGSYEGARDTQHLKNALLSRNDKIVVATIQKMNNLTDIDRGILIEDERKILLSKRCVILIDECHRSQKGQSTANMRSVFNPKVNTQYFGFTGTPIFKENAVMEDAVYSTTDKVFSEELHRYTIRNAVRDKNVLKFNFETHLNVDNEYIKMDENRIKKVVEFVLRKFDAYTVNSTFNTLFATSSKEQLVTYYHIMKESNKKLDKKIKFTAIFSTNKDDAEGNFEKDFIQEVLDDYNIIYNTSESVGNLNSFKANVQDQIRDKRIDLVFVVDMLLTGFDSPVTNTLFIDKPLNYHNLLQAYSRVNRLSTGKFHGNVVTFIEQYEEREKALQLFSAGGSYHDFEIDDYSKVIERLNISIDVMKKVCPDIETFASKIDCDLEEFNESMDLVKNVLKDFEYIKCHPEFKIEDLNMSKKDFGDYKSKYRELANIVKDRKRKETGDDVSLNHDYELYLFEHISIDFKYLMRYVEDNRGEVQKCIDYINDLDLNEKVRTVLIDAVQKYQGDDHNFQEIISNELNNKKVKELETFIKNQNIEDVSDDFIEVAYKQLNGYITTSNSFDYNKVLNKSKTWKIKDGQSNLKAKKEFRENAYNTVEDIYNTYNID